MSKKKNTFPTAHDCEVEEGSASEELNFQEEHTQRPVKKTNVESESTDDEILRHLDLLSQFLRSIYYCLVMLFDIIINWKKIGALLMTDRFLRTTLFAQ